MTGTNPPPGLQLEGGVVTAQQSFAGAGSGTATLSPVTAAITGFDVTVGTAAAANALSIAVTGAAGGTLTYTLASNGNSQVPLQIRFPSPLLPAAAGVAIAVVVTGAAGTPAGDVTVYGIT